MNLLNRPITIVSSNPKRISGQTLDSLTTISIWTIIQSVIIVCLYYLIMRGEDTVVHDSNKTSCFVSSDRFHSQERCARYLKVGISQILVNLIIVTFMVFYSRQSNKVILFHMALTLKIAEELSTAFWYIYEDYESDIQKSPFLIMIVFQSLMAVFEF